MKLARVTQAYLSVLSVFLLAMVAAGTYIWQSGQLPISRADQTATQTPTISLVLDSSQINSGQETTLNLVLLPNHSPITQGHFLLSYPPSLVSVANSTTAGVLSEATDIVSDPATGTVSLSYLPLTGVVDGGTIATFTVKGLQPGQANLDLDTVSQLDTLLPTRVSTVNQESIVPHITNTNVLIN